jgi:hypothetical protein
MGMMRRFSAVCISVCFFSVLLFAGPADGQGTKPDREAERTLFKLINKGRAERSLPKLIHHDFIFGQAEEHSAFISIEGLSEENAHEGFCDPYGVVSNCVDGVTAPSRVSLIWENDEGIDVICESEAVTKAADAPTAARRLYKIWKGAQNAACLFDADYPKHSGAVAITRVKPFWYATFIAAEDSTPAG